MLSLVLYVQFLLICVIHLQHNNFAYEAAADDNVYTADSKTNNAVSNSQKFTADQVEIGKHIKTGRFAEIKRGTLKMKNGNQEVAVKMAKSVVKYNVFYNHHC